MFSYTYLAKKFRPIATEMLLKLEIIVETISDAMVRPRKMR